MSTREYRLAMANMILDTFSRDTFLYEGQHGLRMRWGSMPGDPLTPRHDFTAALRTDGSWPRYGYRQRPFGGTGMQALGQLIRYVRDLPRFPVCTWEYWCSDTVKLGNARTLELVRASDYGNAAKTCCVLCGTADYARGLDWWSLDGKTGPACRYGCCTTLMERAA